MQQPGTRVQSSRLHINRTSQSMRSPTASERQVCSEIVLQAPKRYNKPGSWSSWVQSVWYLHQPRSVCMDQLLQPPTWLRTSHGSLGRLCLKSTPGQMEQGSHTLI